MQQNREAFPAGLYGMLLVAVFGLTLPVLFAPIERVLLGAAAMGPRLVGDLSGTPAAAADAAVLERVAALRADLFARVREHDEHGTAARMPAGSAPVSCRVITTSRRGGGGLPSALRLDRTYAELAGCYDFVTKGDALLGFLQRPGVGLAAEDEADDPALVVLLNDRSSRRVAAALAFEAGGSLRMIVGPSAPVDQQPLRADLWDDPYRASAMQANRIPVYTFGLPGQSAEPPGGLLIGRTRLWGYRGSGSSRPLPIAVFVEPPIAPTALSYVVLWRAPGRGADDAAERAVVEHPATVRDLPGNAGRHLLSTDVAVPDGAAVVRDGLLLGTAHGLAFGMGLVTSFPESRQRWSLLLMPDAEGARPRELEGRVESGDVGRAVVRFTLDRFGGSEITDGFLFTGSNGPHCPAMLLIGRARPLPGATDRLEVRLPVHEGPRAAALIVQGDAR